MNLPHRLSNAMSWRRLLVEDLPISEALLKEFKESTASDDNLQVLMSTLLEGWNSTLDEVSAH